MNKDQTKPNHSFHSAPWNAPGTYPSDFHLLNFVAKYVTVINQYDDDLFEVEYWPKTNADDPSISKTKKLKGEKQPDTLRRCLKKALKATDKTFGNRDWDVLGVPRNQRKKYNESL